MAGQYLLATDGTEASRGSEEYVSKILDPDGTTIHLLHVVETFDREELSEISLSLDLDELEKRHAKKGEEVLKPVARRLEDEGFTTKTEVVHGHSGDEICQRAKELDVDGIFVGRGQHSRLGEMFLGSVSRYVVLRADRSVIVTPTTPS